ncbi:MAG: hypothetical protein PHY47_20605 [Lachnospiraceae bacterium]|nr:hypothetical protein [Lachnospiraceae bacterium]
MYIKKTYILKNTIQVEKGHPTRTGKGEPHKPKTNPTPEQMKIYNLNQAARKLNRKICMNFSPGDYHTVLTYRKENRVGEAESKKELKKFLTKLKREYRKTGEELKYIITTEWRHTAIHHHIIMNHIRGTTEMVRGLWTKGRPRFTALDDTGDYIKLAEYFVKETSKEKIFGREKGKQSYSCSRNLIIPVPKVERIKARDFRGDPKPKKGYFIIKDSVVNGETPFGHKFQYYTMVKIPSSAKNAELTGRRRRNEQSNFNGPPDTGPERKICDRRKPDGSC